MNAIVPYVPQTITTADGQTFELPAGTVIGLSVDTAYFDARENKLKSSSIADWALMDEPYEFENWAAQQNDDPTLVQSGHGSIFWNIAARKPTILSYPSPVHKRGKSDELAALGVLNVDLDVADTLDVPDAATPVGKLNDDAPHGIKQQTYTMQDTIRLAATVRKLNAETAHLMIMIHRLAIRHRRKLLVVLYKFLVGDAEHQTFLRRWLEKSGILPMNNVQWFYALRGKNDWQDCEAVLLVGTPRIRQEDLFMKAQVLHDDDPNLINTERLWRVQPYASQTRG